VGGGRGRHARIVRLVVLVLVAMLAAPAFADPDPPPPPADTAYRSWMIRFDVGALVLIGGGSALAYRSRHCACDDFGSTWAGIGVMSYVWLGSFALHDAGRNDRAVASVALRVALPIAAGTLADNFGASQGGSLLAAGGGIVTTMLIDWFALADARRSVPAQQVTVFAAPSGDGIVAGVAGSL
jgi:hypothetical protein